MIQEPFIFIKKITLFPIATVRTEDYSNIETIISKMAGGITSHTFTANYYRFFMEEKKHLLWNNHPFEYKIVCVTVEGKIPVSAEYLF